MISIVSTCRSPSGIIVELTNNHKRQSREKQTNTILPTWCAIFRLGIFFWTQDPTITAISDPAK